LSNKKIKRAYSTSTKRKVKEESEHPIQFDTTIAGTAATTAEDKKNDFTQIKLNSTQYYFYSFHQLSRRSVLSTVHYGSFPLVNLNNQITKKSIVLSSSLCLRRQDKVTTALFLTIPSPTLFSIVLSPPERQAVHNKVRLDAEIR